MIWFYTLKTLHLFAALFFFGTWVCSYAEFVRCRSPHAIVKNFWIEKAGLVAAVLALITGTLLTSLRYNFQTTWIQAAYFLLLVLTLVLILLKKYAWPFFLRAKHKWIGHISYFLLFFALCLIIHDAVSKQTVFHEYHLFSF